MKSVRTVAVIGCGAIFFASAFVTNLSLLSIIVVATILVTLGFIYQKSIFVLAVFADIAIYGGLAVSYCVSETTIDSSQPEKNIIFTMITSFPFLYLCTAFFLLSGSFIKGLFISPPTETTNTAEQDAAANP